jgi:hypothetical protein
MENQGDIADLAELKSALDRLKAENEALRSQALYWQCDPGIGLIRRVTDERYRKFSPSIRMRYAPVLMSGDAAVHKDAERYRWLRARLVGAFKDWDDNGRGMFGVAFKVPGEAWLGCDENIDAAMVEVKSR